MGYKQKPTIKLNLGELGDNNGTPFFVSIKNLKMLPFSKTIELSKMSRLQKVGDEAITDEQKKELSDFIRSLVVSWNLIDMETEQPVSPQDENALDRVPWEVVTEIFKGLSGSQDESTKNSSEQSVKS